MFNFMYLPIVLGVLFLGSVTNTIFALKAHDNMMNSRIGEVLEMPQLYQDLTVSDFEDISNSFSPEAAMVIQNQRVLRSSYVSKSVLFHSIFLCILIYLYYRIETSTEFDETDPDLNKKPETEAPTQVVGPSRVVKEKPKTITVDVDLPGPTDTMDVAEADLLQPACEINYNREEPSLPVDENRPTHNDKGQLIIYDDDMSTV